MARFWIVGFLLFGFFAASGYAEESLSAVEEEWDPNSAGPITAWTAPLCEKGQLYVQPFFLYNRTRGTFNANGHEDPLPEGDHRYNLQQQLFAQYGLTDRLEIDGQMVYQESFTEEAGVQAHDRGLGDSYLYLRYCLFEETKGGMPHITGVFQLTVPSGKYQHADPDKLGTDVTGAGSWDQGIGFILTKKWKPFIFHADATYNFSQPVRVDGVKTRYANYLNLDGGVEYFLPKGFNLMLEANGYLQGDTTEDGVKTPDTHVRYLTISPGLGWSCDAAQFLLAYQRVVLGANTDANDSVVLTCVIAF